MVLHSGQTNEFDFLKMLCACIILMKEDNSL